MKNLIFNPFEKVAGIKALVIGLLFIVLAVVVGRFSSTHFDGVIDAHAGLPTPMLIYIVEGIVIWIIPAIIFYILGLVLSNSSVRVIDVLGTFALARYPMFLNSFMGFVPCIKNFSVTSISACFVIIAVISILIVIWLIVLMYNAYKVSCNVKGSKIIYSFIAGIIVSEILSKVVLYYFYKSQHVL